MGMIKLLKMEIGQGPEVIEIEHSLKNMQKLVGGWLECIRFHSDIDLWINEEGLLAELDLNFHTVVFVDGGQAQHVHTIVGNVYFASHDDEGNTISLTDEQINKIRYMFRVNREICVVR